MQTLAELELPHLPMDEAAFCENPFPFLEEARKKHPWLATCKTGFVVHEYSAMRQLYGQDDKLREPFDGIVEKMGVKDTPWGRFTEDQLSAMAPEQHRLIRDTFAPKFTPRFANQLRPMMRETIARLLDEWVPKGRFDFEEFASYFPISVMFSLVGAPLEGVGLLRDDLEAIGLAYSLEKDRFPRIQEAMVRLESFIDEVIADRRARPRADGAEDLLDLLVQAGDSGNIDHRQLADLIAFFFIAGYDTSKNVLTFTMHTLLQYPDIYRRCGEDHDYCKRVVEEALRWFNPGTPSRFVNHDFVYRGVLLPKDIMLFFPLSISGRDPVFADADVFNPDRVVEADKRHIAFGLGKHMCLGQYIARNQLQEAIHLIAQRMRDPRLDGEIGWRPFHGTWGLKGLPITFTPAGAG